MVRIDLAWKILHKPREAFEELKDSVDWKEGLTVYGIYSLIGLIFCGAMIKMTGLQIIPIDFGFGGFVNARSLVFSFAYGIAFLGVFAAMSNFFARRLGGNGSFNEVLGMFGYAQAIAIVQGLTGAVMLLAFKFKMLADIGAAIETGVVGVSDYSWFLIGGLILANIFYIWVGVLRGVSLSVSHEISLIRGIAASFLPLLIVEVVLFLVLRAMGVVS
ncbi:MAG: YIP1 family protein [archaeon]